MRMQTIPHFATILAAAACWAGWPQRARWHRCTPRTASPRTNHPLRRSCRIPSHPFAARSDAPPPIPNPTSRSRSSAKGAPNVLLVMTDDVGFGASSTFGGPIPTPTFDKIARRGVRYNRMHTTARVFADAGRADLRPEPSQRAHRVDHGARTRLSGLRHGDAKELRHDRRGAPAERLQHCLVRQESQRAHLANQRGRPVRPLAHGPWLRVLLRLHRRGREPVGPDRVREHHPRRAEGRPHREKQSGLSFRCRSGRPCDPLDSGPARPGAGQAVLRVLRSGRDACPPPRLKRMDRPIQGPV